MLNEILKIIIDIAILIPVLIALWNAIAKAVRGRNWNILVKLVSSLMVQAEELYCNGADRKKWVMEMVAASASSLHFDVDMDVVSDLIDNLCAMAKIVNGPSQAAEVER